MEILSGCRQLGQKVIFLAGQLVGPRARGEGGAGGGPIFRGTRDSKQKEFTFHFLDFPERGNLEILLGLEHPEPNCMPL